jgi:hypothetical protein
MQLFKLPLVLHGKVVGLLMARQQLTLLRRATNRRQAGAAVACHIALSTILSLIQIVSENAESVAQTCSWRDGQLLQLQLQFLLLLCSKICIVCKQQLVHAGACSTSGADDRCCTHITKFH